MTPSEFSQAFCLSWIAVPSCMPEMFGNGGSDEGACMAVLQQSHRSGEPAEPCCSPSGAWGTGWNSALERLVVDGELPWISKGYRCGVL